MNLMYFFKYWLPVIIYAGFIFFVSSISKPPVPGIDIPYLDKILHLTEYAVLSLLISRAFLNSGNAVFLAILISSLYALSDEIHQAFVSLRSAEFSDWIFDVIGACIVLMRGR